MFPYRATERPKEYGVSIILSWTHQCTRSLCGLQLLKDVGIHFYSCCVGRLRPDSNHRPVATQGDCTNHYSLMRLRTLFSQTLVCRVTIFTNASNGRSWTHDASDENTGHCWAAYSSARVNCSLANKGCVDTLSMLVETVTKYAFRIRWKKPRKSL